jgi:hypothetical protein
MAEGEEFANVQSFMKSFFFIFAFIVSFVLMLKPEVELFGMGLFFAMNILYCFITLNGVTNGTVNQTGSEQSAKLGILITGLAFSFVATIFMIMTLATLQSKFATNNTGIQFSPDNRKDFDNTKIIFIITTVMLGVVSLYVYYSADEVRKFTYNIFNTILNWREVVWMRILFPLAVLGVGSALYGQLTLDKIKVNKHPEKYCYPGKDEKMQSFRDNFIKCFGILVSFVILILSRPFIESSYMFGWLTGSSYAKRKSSKLDPDMYDKPPVEPYLFGVNPGIKLFGKILSRWDIFYQCAVYALSMSGLVYASFTIRDFMNISPTNNCLLHDAFIRQLYIAFIFFVIVLYTINTLSAFQFTTLVTSIMRYLAPPTLLGLSSYLVYITNRFSKLSPQLLVQ